MLIDRSCVTGGGKVAFTPCQRKSLWTCRRRVRGQRCCEALVEGSCSCVLSDFVVRAPVRRLRISARTCPRPSPHSALEASFHALRVALSHNAFSSLSTCCAWRGLQTSCCCCNPSGMNMSFVTWFFRTLVDLKGSKLLYD